MNPWLQTAPELRAVLSELVELEPLFHRFGPNAGLADAEAMMADDFWEVGASGRRYDRDVVLAVLEQRLREPAEEHWECRDWCVRELGPDVYLLTYSLRQPDRFTRRATLWRRDDGQWRAEYHQGTVADESDGTVSG
jgi:hypothetical protein